MYTEQDITKIQDFIQYLYDEKDYIVFDEISEFEHEGYLVVQTKSKNFKHKVEFSTILDTKFKSIKRVLDGGSTNPLKHLTRITGYYSPIEQWNPSKREELKQRRRENISINHLVEEDEDNQEIDEIVDTLNHSKKMIFENA